MGRMRVVCEGGEGEGGDGSNRGGRIREGPVEQRRRGWRRGAVCEDVQARRKGRVGFGWVQRERMRVVCGGGRERRWVG